MTGTGRVVDRTSKRARLNIGCWLEDKEEVSCCHTFDLSETGVNVVTDDPLAMGKTVRLQFFTPLSAKAVTIDAEVVWSRLEPEGGMGLRFINLDDRTRAVIRELMRMLRQQPEP